MRHCLLPLLATFLTICTGCQSLATPNWFSPGPLPVQQARAVQFNPLPEDEIGPEIVGARPLGYENPPPETVRARFLPWNWGRR